MQRIINQSHSKDTFLYSLSKMLERAAYYGIRIIIILHLSGEILKLDREDALIIMGWFTAALTFSTIIGALLGDLILGNRKAIIIGSMLQAIGAFSLCIPSTTGLYIGLILISLGGGLYAPNLIANFGKLYLDKTKLLDAGFTTLYLAVNIGVFLGMLLIGLAGEKYGFNIAFMIGGTLMLFSILPILFIGENKTKEIVRHQLSTKRRGLIILLTLVIVGLFWAIYELGSPRLYELVFEFSQISAWDISPEIWASINSYISLPISILAIIIWTYFYSSQFSKLMIGFAIGAIAFVILFLIPENPTNQDTILYVSFLILLGISEVFIAPIAHSILTKYSNPKYLAILISLSFIPVYLISYLFIMIKSRYFDDSITALKFGIIGMTIFFIGLLAFLIWKTRNEIKA